MSLYLGRKAATRFVDFHELCPERFSPIVTTDEGWLRTSGPWTQHLVELPGGDPAVRHSILAVDTGVSGDFTVRVTWRHPDWLDLFGQVGPLCWIPDPDRLNLDTNRTDLGIGLVNDLGLGGAGYPLFGFSSPMNECLWPVHYEALHARDLPEGSDQVIMHSPKLWGWGRTETTISVDASGSGGLFGYVTKDGVSNNVVGIGCPDHLRRNTWHGVHIIEIKPHPGSPLWNWEDPPGFNGPGTYDMVPPPFEFRVEVEMRGANRG